MKNVMTHLLIPSLFTIGTLGASTCVFASEQENFAVQDMQITLIEAVKIAEQSTGGKTVSAQFEGDDPRAVYEIEIVNKPLAWDIKIDANTGKILQQKQD
ncbi:PepSY domain-containing protein [Thiomicrorhabdus arctica]|uniref:PepSY domain-containing protein n=1 Tax=Thiomicrorhabdus arctica TaxID=131540 RepID=UPI000368CA59|nr:PepSY domain-containing protein [Thiomicrorhabdus arctica]